jgi:hypothetical protein
LSVAEAEEEEKEDILDNAAGEEEAAREIGSNDVSVDRTEQPKSKIGSKQGNSSN